MVAIILALAGLVFAYIASWALIGGETMRHRKYPEGNINEKPTNPRPSTPPPAQKTHCDKCSEAFVMGYKKGFADAIRQYGIDIYK